jgi:hypothetical protein
LQRDDRRMPDLKDLRAIEAAIQQVDGKCVVIDPLMAFLPAATDSHRDQDVRRILAPLARLAEEQGVAILVVRHLNKNTAVPGLYRGGGSIGIIGAVRSAMLVAKDPDDESGHRRVLAMLKQNLAAPSPSLAYRVLANDFNVPYISWEGATSHTAESLLATRRERSGSKLGQAAVFLSDLLADGRVPMTEVVTKAAAAGISPKTLRAAKHDLEICSQRVGFGPGSKVYWSLTPIPDDEDE